MPKPENVIGKGFDKYPEHINKKGRPVSIKREIRELLMKDGELPISVNQFIRMDKRIVKGKEKEFYVFKIATQEAMAAELISMAMSRNTNGFRAIQLILEHFDGKPAQSLDVTSHDTIIIATKNDKI